ncbi:VOC family protein [Sphingomonas sp. MA1305]|nr:VOC family protein [Sphingomonas sp. MA1305]
MVHPNRDGGAELTCGWCTDRWGYAWQIMPRVLMQVLSAGDAAGEPPLPR